MPLPLASYRDTVTEYVPMVGECAVGTGDEVQHLALEASQTGTEGEYDEKMEEVWLDVPQDWQQVLRRIRRPTPIHPLSIQ